MYYQQTTRKVYLIIPKLKKKIIYIVTIIIDCTMIIGKIYYQIITTTNILNNIGPRIDTE